MAVELLQVGDRANLFHTGKENLNKTKEGVKGRVETILLNDAEKKELLEYCIKEPDFNRIYLLRHLPVLEDEDFIRYEQLKEEIRKKGNLSAQEEKEFQEKGKNIRIDKSLLEKGGSDIFSKIVLGGKTTLIHGDKQAKNNKRVPESISAIQEKYNLFIHYIDTPGSDKSGTEGQASNKTAGELNKVVENILSSNDGIEHIIISNRSYANAFDREKDDVEISLRESQEHFEKRGYSYLDYENGRPIKRDESYLEINHKNLDELIKIFVKEEEFIKTLDKTDNKTILKFQNGINKYFEEKPELFQELLQRENLSYELQIFCVANLIKKEKYNSSKDLLEKYIKNYNNKSKGEVIEVFKLLYKVESYSELWKDFLLKMKLDKINHSSTELKISDELNEQFNKFCEIKKMSDENSDDIFKNSLDDLIKEKKGIIDRGMYYYKKKTDEEIEKSEKKESRSLNKEEKYNKIKIDISNILSDKKISIILANVGEGKSTQLAIMKDKIDEDINNISLFYSSKNLGLVDNGKIIKQIGNDIKNIKNIFNDSKQIVLFFDGIDELDGKYKKEIKEYLFELGSENIKIILGSRKSEYEEFGTDDYNSIGFEGLLENEKEDFLITRLKSMGVEDIDNKLEEINIFLDSSILDKELKNTPLILFFLAKLSVKNELENINSRAELYEIISVLILTEHNNITERTCKKSLLPDLSELAYDIFRGNIIDIDGSEIKERALLFKKTGDNQYEFIHRSFYEYFLARYISNNSEGSKKIFKFRDEDCLENWNEWRSFKPVISFYSEILSQTDEGLLKLEEFLGENGILKNDDIFGEGFFIGLEILFKLGEKYGGNEVVNKLKKIYLDEILSWKDNIILNKFAGFQEFQKNIGYKKNNFINTFLLLIKKSDFFIYPSLISLDEYGFSMYEEEIIKLGSEGVLNWVEGILNYGYRSNLDKYYKDLVNIGTEKSINVLIKRIYNSFSTKDAIDIFSKLLYVKNIKQLEFIISHIKLFFESDNYYLFEELCYNLMNTGNSKAIDLVIKGLEYKSFNKEYYSLNDIYKNVINKLGENDIERLYKSIKDLSNADFFSDVQYIYSDLLESKNDTIIELILEGIDKTVKNDDIWSISTFCVNLIETGNNNAIIKSIELFNRLLILNDRNKNNYIFLKLINTKNELAINFVFNNLDYFINRNNLSQLNDIFYLLIKLGYKERLGEYLNIISNEEVFLIFETINLKLINEGLKNINNNLEQSELISEILKDINFKKNQKIDIDEITLASSAIASNYIFMGIDIYFYYLLYKGNLTNIDIIINDIGKILSDHKFDDISEYYARSIKLGNLNFKKIVDNLLISKLNTDGHIKFLKHLKNKNIQITFPIKYNG